MEQHSIEDEVLSLIMFLISSGILGGLSLIAFFAPAKHWAIDHGLLVRSDEAIVMLPWDDTAGVDAPRVLILIGAFALGVLLLAMGAVHRHRKRHRVD